MAGLGCLDEGAGCRFQAGQRPTHLGAQRRCAAHQALQGGEVKIVHERVLGEGEHDGGHHEAPGDLPVRERPGGEGSEREARGRGGDVKGR